MSQLAAHCQVTSAGINPNGKVQITLKDNAGAFNTDFIAQDNIKREMLATALACMASGWIVWAEGPSTETGSALTRLIAWSVPG